MINKILYIIALLSAVVSISMLLIGVYINVDYVVYISYGLLIIAAIASAVKCSELMRFQNNMRCRIKYSRIIFALLAILIIPYAIMIGGMIGGVAFESILPNSWSSSNSSRLHYLSTSIGMLGVFFGIYVTIVVPEVIIVIINRVYYAKRKINIY